MLSTAPSILLPTAASTDAREGAGLVSERRDGDYLTVCFSSSAPISLTPSSLSPVLCFSGLLSPLACSPNPGFYYFLTWIVVALSALD